MAKYALECTWVSDFTFPEYIYKQLLQDLEQIGKPKIVWRAKLQGH
jgi:hypothetical protein